MAQDDELRRVILAAGQALSDGDLARFLSLVHPDVEFTSMIAEVDGQTYRGHAGVRRWWADVREAFEEGTWQFREIRGRDDRGVADLLVTGRLGGVPVEQPMWAAFRVRDGRAIWWSFFREERDARAAAGLDE